MGILSKLWAFIKKWWWLILLIVLVVWIFMPALWVSLQSMFASIWAAVKPAIAAIKSFGFLKSLAVGFGLLAAVKPEEASRIVSNVGDVASDIVEEGAGVVSDGIGAILTSPPILLVGGAFLLWLLLRKEKDPAEYNGPIGPVTRERIPYEAESYV